MNEKPTPLAYATFEEFKKAEAEYNKNIETKLTAKVKVELSLAKDISALKDTLKKSWNDSKDMLDEGLTQIDEIAIARDEARGVAEDIDERIIDNMDLVGEANKLITEAEKLTETLGINVEDLPGFVELEEESIALNDMTQDLENTGSDLDDAIGR